jgi:hypothetical protein
VTANIFTNDPSRPDVFHKSKHFWPEVTVILMAIALPGEREGLAGVSSADEVNTSSISICINVMDVLMDRHVGPVLGQHLAAKRVYFTERNRFHAGAF